MLSSIHLSRRAFGIGSASLLASTMMTTRANAAVTLRMGSEEPFSDPPRVAAQFGLDWLSANVGPRTNGEVNVMVTGNAALGPERVLLTSVAGGIVDACVSSPGNTAALVPEVQLFSASYLFSGFEHVLAVISDDAFFGRLQELVRDRNIGMQLGGVAITGSRNLYNRRNVATELAHISGMSMRVMNSPTEVRVWSTLGMIPATIPAPEIYSALQSGVVDAGESSISAIVGSRYYEVAPYITLTNHQFNLMFYFIGDAALRKVPEAAREPLMATFREAALVQARAAVELQESSLEYLRSRPGVEVTELDVAPFQELLMPLQDEIAGEFGLQDLLEQIRAMDPNS